MRTCVAAAALGCVLGVAGPPAVAQPALPAAVLPVRLPVADGDGAAWSLHAGAAAFEAADATPVRGIEGDWRRYAPRAGRNAALQSMQLELGAVRQRWELTALLRSGVAITGSRAAFDVVHAYKQRLAPADGSAFDVQAHGLGLVIAGLRVAHTWVLPAAGTGDGLQLTAALSLLSVRRLQQRDAAGSVRYTAAGGYAFDAQTLQQASDRQFGGYGRPDATGAGHAADLGLLWRPSADSVVNVCVTDALSRLRVDGVSTQQAALSSSTAALDANGYVEYRPLVTGRNSAADLALRLPAAWTASVGTRWAAPRGDLWVGAHWQRIAGVDIPALWLTVPVAAGWRLQLDGETRFRSLGIGLRSKHAELALRSSSTRPGQARALGWRAAVDLGF